MIGYIEFPSWISPTVIPGLPLRWYGMMYLVAFGITYLLFRHEMRRRNGGIESDQIADFFFWTIFGVLLGGRLFYVLILDPERTFFQKPWTIIWPFTNGRFTGIQGMNYYGGLFGAVIAAVSYTTAHRLDILEWGDTLAVSAPLGYTFGRLGNFINGELTGRVSAVPWAVLFPNARRFPASESWVPAMADDAGVPIYDPAQLINLPRHPSQLYEAALEGVLLWLVLWCVFRKQRPFKGALIALYVLGYGAARLVTGYFREAGETTDFAFVLGHQAGPATLVAHGMAFTEAQIASLVMMAIGAVALIVFRLLHQDPPVIETFEQ